MAVLASLLVAVACAALVVWMTRPPATDSATAPLSLPHPVDPPDPVVRADPDRAVPPSIRASANRQTAGYAPGLRLVEPRPSPTWERGRAVIRDETDGDVRAYAIGDLLPHGALLVGIGEDHAEVFVSDMELVRLTETGVVPTVDFRTAYEARALDRGPDLSPDYRDAVEEAIRALRTAQSNDAQLLLDELVACGDPAVEILVPFADDPVPVSPYLFEVPSGSGVFVEPKVSGDLVIAVLEQITGQTFGDPTREGLSARERGQIAVAWRRWWGVE